MESSRRGIQNDTVVILRAPLVLEKTACGTPCVPHPVALESSIASAKQNNNGLPVACVCHVPRRCDACVCADNIHT